MKRHIFIASLMVIAGTMLATSCIDDRYDLNKLDTEMNLLPGMTVPVNQTVNLPVGQILPEDCKFLSINSDKKYQLDFTRLGDEITSIPKKDFDERGEVLINSTFSIFHDDMPVTLDDFALMTDTPIALTVNNPTSETLFLSATIEKGTSILDEIYDIGVPPGRNTVTLDLFDTEKALNPFDRNVTIKNISLKKANIGPTSVAAPNKTSDEGNYDFSVDAFLPMEFKAGEGIAFRYATDFFNESGIIDALKEYNLDISTMDITATVTNKFPFDINVNTQIYKDDDSKKISIDKTIVAGSAAKPVDTDIVIKASDFGNLSNIKEVYLKVSAIIPEGVKTDVSLASDQSLDIKVKNITLKDGFTVGKK